MLPPDGAPVDVDLAYTFAANEGVSVRPLLRKVTDRATGDVRTVPIRCGSTRESVCPPCATKARRVRMQQCREGWHLTEDPPLPERGLGQESGGHEDGEDPGEVDSSPERRVRSTRRRQDAPDLPRVPMEDRTTGQAFTAPDGTCYRPSMFITRTLPSYGKVIPGTGIPADPARYDYRRAALDALHFPKLVDRLWQNLRRCAGFKVQYFSAVEAQRRLAPHLHAAIRGAIPRKTIRQVTKATYFHLWWPAFDEVRYDTDRLPVWDREAGGYCDPDTGRPQRTFRDALDELDNDPDATPAHVVRFGQQTDVKGLAGSLSERKVPHRDGATGPRSGELRGPRPASRGGALPRPPAHGHHLAAASGASTRELMGRMCHSSRRAALIYQHRTADRDRLIADALDSLIDASQRTRSGGPGGLEPEGTRS